MKRSETTEDGVYRIDLYTCQVQGGCVILVQEIYKGDECTNRSLVTLGPEDMKALIKEFRRFTKN